MNSLEQINQVILVGEALLPVVARTLTILVRFAQRLQRVQLTSYENLSLDITLDIADARGRRANVTCKQRVHLLVADGGVIASPFWGDGDQMADYEVEGARRLGEHRDGPRTVQLLGLDRPVLNRQATLVMRRKITDGFRAKSEYFESSVERPTKRLVVRILFPRARPPTRTQMVESSGSRTAQPRLSISDGRTCLSVHVRAPKPGAVYSLRWSW